MENLDRGSLMKRRFVYVCRDQYGFYVFGVYYQGQKMGHAYVSPGTFWGRKDALL